MSLEIKKTFSHFAYRIEEKPGGGFIAQPLDPANAPLEAPTREELMQKLQAQTAAEIQRELPELLAAGGLEGKLANLLLSKTGLKGTLKVDITTTKHLDGTTTTKTITAGTDGTLLPPPTISVPQNAPAAPMIVGTDTGTSTDRTGTMLRIIAALVALGSVIYFLMQR